MHANQRVPRESVKVKSNETRCEGTYSRGAFVGMSALYQPRFVSLEYRRESTIGSAAHVYSVGLASDTLLVVAGADAADVADVGGTGGIAGGADIDVYGNYAGVVDGSYRYH